MAEEVILLSGYRTPETNRAIRRAGRRVATKSYHLHGKATDMKVAGVPSHVLGNICCDVVGKRGAVGHYARFVHIDTRGHRYRWYG